MDKGIIHTLDELQNLLSNRPEKSKMVRVEESAMELVKKKQHMRIITEEEVAELAEYLCVSTDELRGPFLIESSLKCTSCSRNVSFLDFVKAAPINHSKDMIKKVVCGRNGYWVTVKGKNESLDVKCIKCGSGVTYDNFHYSCVNYAYA